MKLFENILGLDKIMKKIDSLESTIKKNDEKEFCNENNKKINLISEYSNEQLLSIEILQDYNEYDLKNPISVGSRVNAIFQALPMGQIVYQDKMLDGAFKVVMPKGVGGKLMQYKNGLFGTPVVGANNRIQGHAGLQKISSLSINPALIFTTMSFFTGQYFMSQINTSLQNISQDVKQIIKILLDDKKSRNYAIYEFYLEIISNMDIILDNSDIRISYLTNIQSTLIDLRQNIKFYEKNINDIIDRENGTLYYVIDEKNTNDRIYKAKKKFKELNDFLVQRCFCLQLFIMGKVLETQLAQIYDDRYIEKIIIDLETVKEDADKYNREIVDSYEYIFRKIEGKNRIWSPKDIYEQRDKIKKQIEDSNDKFIRNSNSTIEGIYKFKQFNQKENTFIIEGKNLYIVEN